MSKEKPKIRLPDLSRVGTPEERSVIAQTPVAKRRLSTILGISQDEMAALLIFPQYNLDPDLEIVMDGKRRKWAYKLSDFGEPFVIEDVKIPTPEGDIEVVLGVIIPVVIKLSEITEFMDPGELRDFQTTSTYVIMVTNQNLVEKDPMARKKIGSILINWEGGALVGLFPPVDLLDKIFDSWLYEFYEFDEVENSWRTKESEED